MKTIKIISVVTAILLLIAVVGFSLAYYAFQLPALDRGGWTEQNGAVQYLDYYGKPKTQWQTIDGKRYYFSPDGNLSTGWQTIEGQCYYFGNDGQLYTGFLELDGQCYYLTEEGKPYTGWLEQQGQKRYFAGGEGLRRSGWLELPEGKYFLDSEGNPQTGWIEVLGVRYYLKSDGILDEAWQHDGKTLRYLVSGKPHTGWYRGEEGVFYFDPEGVQTTGWVTDESGRFYLYPDGTYATGFVEIEGVERYFQPTGEYVLLCNRRTPVPEDYEPELVELEKDHCMDVTCAAALLEMLDAARQEGYKPRLNSTYRSKADQQGIWNRRVKAEMAKGISRSAAEAKVGRNVTVPGTSEHQTGLAVDIGGGSALYRWLAENSWKYGFILRYPEQKTEVTGIDYEPWHYRYVGRDLAKAITESGLCLEEYLQQLKGPGQIPE